MKKYIAFPFLFACIVFKLHAQNSSVLVKTNSQTHAISPYIYGTNASINDGCIKSIRQGGNRWTGYNWENGNSNSGSDYGNVTDSYLLSNIPSDSNNVPGAATTYFFEKARDNGQFFLTTIPMAGYVAFQSGTATYAPSAFWNTIIPFKGSTLSLIPDLNDNFVYTDEYVNFLKSKYGIASNGGINAYGLDNEPDLWKKTHPYLHRSNTKINELINKTITTARAIKSIDSSALIFGPSMSGWAGCKDFNGIDDNVWFPVCSNPGDPYFKEWFLSLYLDSMKYYSNYFNRRLIDVVNIHWYPEAVGDDGIRIVNTSGGTEPLSQTAIKARLQAPRSFWDSTYTEQSYITNSLGKPINLLNRIRETVNKYFPGTKIGITEYRFGTENHFSGGLALADALGVFGKEDLFYASKWYAQNTTMLLNYSSAAFNLYTNYDGKFSMFGNNSIETLNSSNDTLSTFASFDSQKRLHVIAINKIATNNTLRFDFDGNFYKAAYVCGFDSASVSIIQRDSIKSTLPFNKCTYLLPKYSALHFVFEPIELPKIVYAATDSVNTKQIKVVFNSKIKSTILNPSDLVIIGKNGIYSTLNASIIDSIIIINVSSDFLINDSSIYLTLSKQIFDINDIPLKNIDSLKILNLLKGSLPQFLSSTMFNNGKEILLTFSKPVIAVSNSGFTLIDKTFNVMIVTTIIKDNTITLQLNERLNNQSSISGSYNDASGIVFSDNTKISNITSFTVDNILVSNDLLVDSIFILNAGFTLSIQCNKKIDINSTLKDFKFFVNNKLVQCNGSISKSRILFSFPTKLEYSDTIRMDYTDNGNVKSFESGFLHSFSRNVFNSIPKPPAIISIPAKIESDSVYYKIGNVTKTSNSSDGKGASIKIYTDGEATFRIIVPKDTTYTLILNHSCIDNIELLVKIGNQNDTLKFPSTSSFSTFKQFGTVLSLTKGNYVVSFKTLKPLTKSVEIYNFPLIYGEHIPKSNFLTGQIPSTGKVINVFIDSYIKTTPVPTDFNLQIDKKIVLINAITIKDNVFSLIIDDTIYSKQNVQLSLVDSTIETQNNGTVAVFSKTINNYSKVIGVGNSIINLSNIKIAKDLTISNIPVSSIILLYNVLGVEICRISTIENTIKLNNNLSNGCYFLYIKNSGEIIYQNKIVITK